MISHKSQIPPIYSKNWIAVPNISPSVWYLEIAYRLPQAHGSQGVRAAVWAKNCHGVICVSENWGFHWNFVGFYWILWGFNGDLKRFYRDLMNMEDLVPQMAILGGKIWVHNRWMEWGHPIFQTPHVCKRKNIWIFTHKCVDVYNHTHLFFLPGKIG